MPEKTLICLSTLLLSILSTACASKPIVDTSNVNMAHYTKDLTDCEEVAEQVTTGQITAQSAAFGATVGAANGLLWHDVGRGAANGAIIGGAGGLLRSGDEKSLVTKNCLRHRGYVVLN